METKFANASYSMLLANELSQYDIPRDFKSEEVRWLSAVRGFSSPVDPPGERHVRAEP